MYVRANEVRCGHFFVRYFLIFIPFIIIKLLITSVRSGMKNSENVLTVYYYRRKVAYKDG